MEEIGGRIPRELSQREIRGRPPLPPLPACPGTADLPTTLRPQRSAAFPRKILDASRLRSHRDRRYAATLATSALSRSEGRAAVAVSHGPHTRRRTTETPRLAKRSGLKMGVARWRIVRHKCQGTRASDVITRPHGSNVQVDGRCSLTRVACEHLNVSIMRSSLQVTCVFSWLSPRVPSCSLSLDPSESPLSPMGPCESNRGSEGREFWLGPGSGTGNGRSCGTG
jgi:hypothetical protein